MEEATTGAKEAFILTKGKHFFCSTTWKTEADAWKFIMLHKPFPYATGYKHPKDDGYEVKKVMIWMKQT